MFSCICVNVCSMYTHIFVYELLAAIFVIWRLKAGTWLAGDLAQPQALSPHGLQDLRPYRLAYQSIIISVYRSSCLSLPLFVCVCVFIYPSMCLALCLSVYLSIYTSIYLVIYSCALILLLICLLIILSIPLTKWFCTHMYIQRAKTSLNHPPTAPQLSLHSNYKRFGPIN